MNVVSEVLLDSQSRMYSIDVTLEKEHMISI